MNDANVLFDLTSLDTKGMGDGFRGEDIRRFVVLFLPSLDLIANIG